MVPHADRASSDSFEMLLTAWVSTTYSAVGARVASAVAGRGSFGCVCCMRSSARCEASWSGASVTSAVATGTEAVRESFGWLLL
ncbi:hypothetical protein V7S43_011519 [Phytophthora oleae]|uniref:Uncharacterized protein n=1 Tax=Phytophthora oleae TaxID=2107226 RepID=A0ABD3F9S7_9STRA